MSVCVGRCMNVISDHREEQDVGLYKIALWSIFGKTEQTGRYRDYSVGARVALLIF